MQQQGPDGINLQKLGDIEILDLSRKMILSLDLNEMNAIKSHFAGLGRNPTDAELETIAQTWSEHCKHKVFNCTIDFESPTEKETIQGLFKTYIAGATEKISKKKKGMLVSVFTDNAGVIAFNKKYDICMKVETHNHPSALEPYGGANTGLGGWAAALAQSRLPIQMCSALPSRGLKIQSCRKACCTPRGFSRE